MNVATKVAIASLRISSLSIGLILGPAMALAQTSSQVFSLPNTDSSAQWVKLGTFNGSQGGYDVDVRIVSSNGYNANISQNQVSYIHFKTSNGNSTDGNGFAGDSWWYQTGPNINAPNQVVWIANAAGIAATAFTLYAQFGVYTGADSYYVVEVPPGTTWTNTAAAGQSAPGSGSSTVLIAQNQMYVGSPLSLGASLTYSDGTRQTTAWTGVLCGGDYAEDVETTESKTAYEPGDVLVISTNSDKDVQKSQEPYSTSVAGIYATKPGVIGRRGALAKVADDIPMAMVGIVPTKVSAENGPIRRGDLLVTSSLPGLAMKGTDRGRMLGAVIGKAMGTLESGTGVIQVLVTLQ